MYLERSSKHGRDALEDFVIVEIDQFAEAALHSACALDALLNHSMWSGIHQLPRIGALKLTLDHFFIVTNIVPPYKNHFLLSTLRETLCGDISFIAIVLWIPFVDCTSCPRTAPCIHNLSVVLYPARATLSLSLSYHEKGPHRETMRGR